jgi:4-hydroxybenzoate polyprenyltransferase
VTRLRDVLSLLRIQTAGFEGFLFLVGPLLTGNDLPLSDAALLWTLGALSNGYIFALNDLVDLPHDRLNPRRQTSALVSGRVSERLALTLSLLLPLAALLTVVLAGWARGPIAMLILILALAAAVNVYQKATRRPLQMDVLFSVTMAGPLPVTAWAITGGVSTVVWLGTVTLFLLSLELNSVAGNLKDLATDAQVGFTTVAVVRGARLAPDGTLLPGSSYSRYVRMLHIAVTLTALATVGAAAAGRPRVVQVGVAFAVAGLVGWGARDLAALLGARRKPSANGRETWFAAGFALLLLPISLRAPGVSFIGAIAALAAWEVSCRPQSLTAAVRRRRPTRR